MPPAEAPSQRRSASRPVAPPTGRQPATRRTVVIRGQVAPRAGGTDSVSGPARRRPPRRPSERIAGSRPDRAAMWAVMMGVFLILTAVLTAHGA